MIVLEPNSGVMADVRLFKLTTCDKCAVWLSENFASFKYCPICRIGHVHTYKTIAKNEGEAKLQIHLSVLKPSTVVSGVYEQP